MFNEYVILHTPPAIADTNQSNNNKNVCLSEKTTQAGDGNIWKVSDAIRHTHRMRNVTYVYDFFNRVQVNLGHNLCSHAMNNILTDCSDLNFNDTMTCQELLAFSVAFSAALPTSQNTLESFYSSLTRNEPPANGDKVVGAAADGRSPVDNFSCCYHLYQNATHVETLMHSRTTNKCLLPIVIGWKWFRKVASFMRRCIKVLVDHKYFQQGILLAILINTLSMGIEYHDQPAELTAIVETSNIVFSGIFAVEMLLKVVAEGPFRYIANGFNVFDGVIVILR